LSALTIYLTSKKAKIKIVWRKTQIDTRPTPLVSAIWKTNTLRRTSR
jgi:hypothetical protein